jgi:type IV pilus assembly protein PilQ
VQAQEETAAEQPASDQAAQQAEAGQGAEPSAAESESADAADSNLISLDFKEADLQQVLRIISLKSGVDIVSSPDVAGVVTMKLTNVPWEQALDIILRTYSLTYERKGNIVRVMTVDALANEALSTEVFPLGYAKAENVPDIINEMLSDRGRVKFDARTNAVVVSDIPPVLFQIKQVVERIDQPEQQVLIETRIVETKLEKEENLGIDWSDSVSISQSATSLGTSFPFVADATMGTAGDDFLASPITKATAITLGTLTGPALAVTINALKERTDTRVVSNPTLAVMNNQEAKIHIGEEFPVPSFSVNPSTGNTTISGFDSKTLGTVLKVTPHVNLNREVLVDLEPQIIAFLANTTFSTGGTASVSLPRFTTQTVKTQVRVLDGETIAIGGLVKETDIFAETKVPFLSEIPIIGLLFSSGQRFGGGTNPALKQDLLIFLTVKLMDQPKRKIASSGS